MQTDSHVAWSGIPVLHDSGCPLKSHRQQDWAITGGAEAPITTHATRTSQPPFIDPIEFVAIELSRNRHVSLPSKSVN
jgi:hypothetical protein